MTTLMFRYFVAHVTRMVAFTVAAIAAMFYALTLLDNLGRGTLDGILDSVRDSLLEMPEIIYLALPSSCVVGTAVGLALLDSRREFALMRLMGVSSRRLAGWLVSASVLWMACYLALSEYVLPSAAAITRDIEIQRSGSFISAGEEIWIKTSDGFARLDAIAPASDRVVGVWTFSGDGDSIDTVNRAALAVHDGQSWTLRSVSQARLADGIWRFTEMSRTAWPQGPDPALLTAFSIEPSNLRLGTLMELSRSQRELGQNTATIDLVIWGRLFDALSICLLMLACVLLVRTRTRPSAGAVRGTAAISLLAMLLYYNLAQIVRQFSIDRDWPAYVGAGLPLLLIGALALGAVGWRTRN